MELYLLFNVPQEAFRALYQCKMTNYKLMLLPQFTIISKNMKMYDFMLQFEMCCDIIFV